MAQPEPARTAFRWPRWTTIAWHEYVINLRRPGFIFFTLLPCVGSLLGLLVLLFYARPAVHLVQSQLAPTRPAPIGVVDQSGLFRAVPAALADRLTIYADEAAARQALLGDAVGAYVVIPPDYLASGKVTSYVKEGGFLNGVSLTNSTALTPFLVDGLLAGKVDDAVARRVAAPASVTPVTLDAQGQPVTKTGGFAMLSEFIIPSVLSMFLVISIFTSSSYLLRSVSEEKETRVIEIVLSSVSAYQLLAGKVVGLGALGLTQMAVWLMSAVVFSGGAGAVMAGALLALNPQVMILSAAYFLLGYVVYATLMAATGALGTNIRESQQVAGMFSFMAVVPYFLNTFTWLNPNLPVLRVLSYFPLTAPTMMMLRLPVGGVPAVDIVGSLAILVVTVPLCGWAGARVFRAGLLMRGKRPSLRQIWRMLAVA
jgi:ABC-2 type transport system permease protein